MDIKDFQKIVIEKARRRGFSDCEVYYSKGNDFQLCVSGGELEQYETSSSSGAAFRGVINNKAGFAYTERFDEYAADFVVNAAAENAEISESENEEIFFEGSEYTRINLYNKELEGVTSGEKIQYALDAEKAAIEYSDKVRAVDRCIYADGETTISIMNTKGLDADYSANSIVGYISVICADGDDIKTGGDFCCGNDFKRLDAHKLGENAASQTVKHLGAKSIKSGKYKTIIKNSAMADILAVFSNAFSAEQMDKGLSMLTGKENNIIASECITIRDDGLLEGGYASAVFDGEGVPCSNKVIVENGILKTFLYDLKYAEKYGKKTTGNGFRAGYSSPVFVGCTNFYIVNGSNSFEELAAQAKNGIVITDVTGLHAGANPVSGDFSLSAEGFMIEDGIVTGPIEQITVAGNYFEMLKNILAVADDLKFTMRGIGSPSVLIEEMMVSGL